MGGDMFPHPQQIPNRVNDYALDIRGDQGAEQENQASTLGGHVGIVRVEKKEADMMLLGKREREGYAAPSPNKKKGKEKEGEDAKAKRKRRPCRKFEVTDLPLGEGQTAYDLKEDLSGRKIDCTFGQLMNMRGLGAFLIILGQPWLRAVGAIQDWGKGTICVYGKKGEKMVFDMTTKQPLELEDMSENDESDLTSEDSSEESESSTTSSSSDKGGLGRVGEQNIGGGHVGGYGEHVVDAHLEHGGDAYGIGSEAGTGYCGKKVGVGHVRDHHCATLGEHLHGDQTDGYGVPASAAVAHHEGPMEKVKNKVKGKKEGHEDSSSSSSAAAPAKKVGRLRAKSLSTSRIVEGVMSRDTFEPPGMHYVKQAIQPLLLHPDLIINRKITLLIAAASCTVERSLDSNSDYSTNNMVTTAIIPLTDGPLERSSLSISSSSTHDDDATLLLHTHDPKRLKLPATSSSTYNHPTSLLAAAASPNFPCSAENRLPMNYTAEVMSPFSTANCSLKSSTSNLRSQEYYGRDNSFSHTAPADDNEQYGAAESYSFAGFSKLTSNITQSTNLAALPLMSNLSSKSTAEQAPLLQDLPPWFVSRMVDDSNVEVGSRAAGGDFAPGQSTEAKYLPAGHYNERSSRSSSGTQGMMALLGRQARDSCNHITSKNDPGPLSNLLGKAAAHEQNVVSASTLRAQVVAHPLFEHLLAAHFACLRVGSPPQQWLGAGGAEAWLSLMSKQQLEAKYLLLAGNAPHIDHEKEHLDHFMLSLILLLQTFREQIREHMHQHLEDAITGYTEIKEAFIRLTAGDTSLNDCIFATSTTNTMSDDDSTGEDDHTDEEAAAAVDAFDHLAMHENDMHMMMMNGSNMHSDIDRPLMDRVCKELKSALKQARENLLSSSLLVIMECVYKLLQDYRSKLWDVREEIMRKRRAGKLPGSTTSHLRHWWDAHSKWPYPTEEEKQRLGCETGLELKQINNWSINQRKRNWTTNPALERVELWNG
ncbi:hypothetical protein L7F22_036474 [Adiantum nelumboides]|nr:hypothetical protein [Adiantum nelumboides]